MLIYGVDLLNGEVCLRNFNNYNDLTNNTEICLFYENPDYTKKISLSFLITSRIIISNYVYGNVYLYSYSYNYSSGSTFNFKINFLYRNIYQFFIYTNNIRNIYLFTQKSNDYWKQIHLKNKNSCISKTISDVVKEGYVIETFF